jgi:hypothetical protein
LFFNMLQNISTYSLIWPRSRPKISVERTGLSLQ